MSQHELQNTLIERDGPVCYICKRFIAFVSQVRILNTLGKIRTNKRNGKVFLHKGRRLPFRVATIDHVIPKSKGGTDAISNLKLACYLCNLQKANTLLKVI